MLKQRKRPKFSWLDGILAILIAASLGYVMFRIRIGLNYHWDWSAIPQYLFRYDPEGKGWVPNLLMQGLFTTIRLSIWSTLLATIMGAVMGLCRVSPRLFRRLLGRTYVESIRNLPPLVLVFIFYFFLGDQIMAALGLEGYLESLSREPRPLLVFLFGPVSQIPAFLSAVITLGIFEGAYITEIVRAGVQSIEKGQWEASYALGLSRWQQLRHIILPQATRRILPPLAGQFISTIKDSAIVAVISIQELTFQGMELMSATYLTFEVWITIAFLYFALTLCLSTGVGQLETYMRKKEA